MSPQAIADPEELERFAQELKQFTSQLDDSMKRLNSRFGRLSDTWRDQEHQKFARDYQQTMRVLTQFMHTADQQIPFLQRKAARIRDYLNQR